MRIECFLSESESVRPDEKSYKTPDRSFYLEVEQVPRVGECIDIQGSKKTTRYRIVDIFHLFSEITDKAAVNQFVRLLVKPEL